MNQPIAGALELNGRKYPIPALTLKNWERLAAAMAAALSEKTHGATLPRVLAGMTAVVCLGMPRLAWFGRWPRRELRHLAPEELQRVFEAVLDAWQLGKK